MKQWSRSCSWITGKNCKTQHHRYTETSKKIVLWNEHPSTRGLQCCIYVLRKQSEKRILWEMETKHQHKCYFLKYNRISSRENTSQILRSFENSHFSKSWTFNFLLTVHRTCSYWNESFVYQSGSSVNNFLGRGGHFTGALKNFPDIVNMSIFKIDQNSSFSLSALG